MQKPERHFKTAEQENLWLGQFRTGFTFYNGLFCTELLQVIFKKIFLILLAAIMNWQKMATELQMAKIPSPTQRLHFHEKEWNIQKK